MALSIGTIGAAVEDPVFLARVKGAMYVTGGTVFVEAANVPNHANRLLWVKAIASEPIHWLMRMVTSVAALNAGIAGTTLSAVTDAQVQTAMDNLVNFYSALVAP